MNIDQELKDILEAINIVQQKLRTFEEPFNSLRSEVSVLENQKIALLKDIKAAQEILDGVEKERTNLQLLIEDKKKEQAITLMGIKHAREDVERQSDILNTRESNLDVREARIKDREAMYNIRPEK